VGFRSRPGFLITVMASAGAATLVHLVHPGPLSIAVGAATGILAAAVAVDPAEARR
jgi:hypothetical protein